MMAAFRGDNMGGLGLGPLVAGLFAEYGPNPTVLVFEVYLGLLVIAFIFLLVLLRLWRTGAA